ncbi:hypothetical protein [Luteimonas sp. TWI1416]|uniref:hypothetical protein n=1 Tax=unclassified Luteimonas TaxID=2629088 RepID=UPI00320895E5
MTRRLQTPIIACGVSAAALCAVLLAAAPSLSAGRDATASAAGGLNVATTAAARDVAIGDAEPQDAAPRSRSRRGRSAIAMPYFSFARGTGGRG